jgi:hypothetical protein
MKLREFRLQPEKPRPRPAPESKGKIMLSRDGRTAYLVQDDGAWKKLSERDSMLVHSRMAKGAR